MRESEHKKPSFNENVFVDSVLEYLKKQSPRQVPFLELYDEAGENAGFFVKRAGHPKRQAAGHTFATHLKRLFVRRPDEVKFMYFGTGQRKSLHLQYVGASSANGARSAEIRVIEPPTAMFVLDDLPFDVSKETHFYIVEQEIQGLLRYLKMAKDLSANKPMSVSLDVWKHAVEQKTNALMSALAFYLERIQSSKENKS